MARTYREENSPVVESQLARVGKKETRPARVNRTELVLLQPGKNRAQFDWILSSNDVFLSYPFGLLP
jgi:hypothetical protein